MVEEKVIDILVDLCDDDKIKDDLDIELFESGLLDSLAFTELLYAIEEQLGVIIAPSEISRSDMDTPRKIIDLIKERIK